ncbi:hypothetical protein FOA52_005427 [Chlamydomonas sp. UWO 241]|nr:hypothetical protein FOA52_005427 [Chlamydomonas sp. UWO 241]
MVSTKKVVSTKPKPKKVSSTKPKKVPSPRPKKVSSRKPKKVSRKGMRGGWGGCASESSSNAFPPVGSQLGHGTGMPEPAADSSSSCSGAVLTAAESMSTAGAAPDGARRSPTAGYGGREQL